MSSQPKIYTYETLSVGERFVSTGRTITEADHGTFLMLSGNWHPIHCDEEYAKTTPMGRRIASGTLGITLALGGLEANLLHCSDPLIAALGIKEWNYKAPIFIGDTLHIEMEITDKRLTGKGDRYLVERLLRLINQRGTVVQEGKAISMWQRQTGAAGGPAG